MSNFEFHNVNPLGLREQDCVCRAISLALNRDYYDIEDKLKLVGELFECEFLCVDCYKMLLDCVFNLTRIEAFHGWTINEFCEEGLEGIFIIRVEGHLTCIMNKKIKDIWDCGEEVIDIIWRVC